MCFPVCLRIRVCVCDREVGGMGRVVSLYFVLCSIFYHRHGRAWVAQLLLFINIASPCSKAPVRQGFACRPAGEKSSVRT